MRLLKFKELSNSPQLDIKIANYNGRVPWYAILSHRWDDPDEEVSYQDIQRQDDSVRNKRGYEKVVKCCRRALKDGLKYAWIDTCCIDKTSSAEISEAINSMFKWYKESYICYAYLQDVKTKANHRDEESDFRRSQWFTRGWTLQEMIAPNEVAILGEDWSKIGTRYDMAELLCEITTVPENILCEPRGKLDEVCISQKMYWASRRQTSRMEDRAYSLLGLFKVSIPILYGEGPQAFMRLQEELVGISFDHTIFAWHLNQTCSGLLADSPDAFALSGEVQPLSMIEYRALVKIPDLSLEYTMTNVGLSICLPYYKLKSHASLYVTYLACYVGDISKLRPISLYLRRFYGKQPQTFLRARKPTKSTAEVEGMKKPFVKEKLNSPSRIWVAMPDEVQKKSVRPLVPYLSSDIRPRSYRIHLLFPGRALNVYPMADQIKANEIVIEMETRCISIAVIQVFDDLQIWFIIAVIDNKLMCHIEPSTCSEFGSSSIRHCLEWYKKRRLSYAVPCCSTILPGRPLSPKIQVEIYPGEFRAKDTFLVLLNFGTKELLENVYKSGLPLATHSWNTSLRELLDVCEPLTEQSIGDWPLKSNWTDNQYHPQDPDTTIWKYFYAEGQLYGHRLAKAYYRYHDLFSSKTFPSFQQGIEHGYKTVRFKGRWGHLRLFTVGALGKAKDEKCDFLEGFISVFTSISDEATPGNIHLGTLAPRYVEGFNIGLIIGVHSITNAVCYLQS